MPRFVKQATETQTINKSQQKIKTRRTLSPYRCSTGVTMRDGWLTKHRNQLEGRFVPVPKFSRAAVSRIEFGEETATGDNLPCSCIICEDRSGAWATHSDCPKSGSKWREST